MSKRWRIELNNDTGANDEGYHEWRTVTDGNMSFDCKVEADAQWLCVKLNALDMLARAWMKTEVKP